MGGFWKKAPVWLGARCNSSSWGYEGTEGYTNRQLKHLLQASGDPRLIIICFIFCVESAPESLGACTASVCAQLRCLYFHTNWRGPWVISANKLLPNSVTDKAEFNGHWRYFVHVPLLRATWPSEEWNPAEKNSRKQSLLPHPRQLQAESYNTMTGSMWNHRCVLL